MDSQTRTYVFNTLFFVGIAIAIFTLTGSPVLTAYVISIMVAVSMIAKGFLENLFATLFMMAYPIYQQGDVVVLSNSIASTPLAFSKLGILRTPLVAIDGVVYAPNTDLLNGYVKRMG